MSVYWLGLLTDTGAEPPASAGYGRVALDLPDTGAYANPEPIIFCKARFAWPVLTHAGLFTDASLGVAFMTTPLAPPPYSVPTPIAVDETEEAVVPTGWLRFEFIAAGTPRPYGRFRYGRLAYSRWPDGAVVQFRVGARLLADKIDVNCQAWAPAPTWLGRVCS
jgi:hypothetical protein